MEDEYYVICFSMLVTATVITNQFIFSFELYLIARIKENLRLGLFTVDEGEESQANCHGWLQGGPKSGVRNGKIF